VATDVGDNSYLIEDGLNGFLVGCKDIDSIAEKLNILIGSEELRNRFGEFSQDKIMRDFSMDRMQSGYLTLLSNFFKL
jgi:glycosyltransferase involved in cell wall biosynthesis